MKMDVQLKISLLVFVTSFIAYAQFLELDSEGVQLKEIVNGIENMSHSKIDQKLIAKVHPRQPECRSSYYGNVIFKNLTELSQDFLLSHHVKVECEFRQSFKMKFLQDVVGRGVLNYDEDNTTYFLGFSISQNELEVKITVNSTQDVAVSCSEEGVIFKVIGFHPYKANLAQLEKIAHHEMCVALSDQLLHNQDAAVKVISITDFCLQKRENRSLYLTFTVNNTSVNITGFDMAHAESMIIYYEHDWFIIRFENIALSSDKETWKNVTMKFYGQFLDITNTATVIASFNDMEFEKLDKMATIATNGVKSFITELISKKTELNPLLDDEIKTVEEKITPGNENKPVRGKIIPDNENKPVQTTSSWTLWWIFGFICGIISICTLMFVIKQWRIHKFRRGNQRLNNIEIIEL